MPRKGYKHKVVNITPSAAVGGALKLHASAQYLGGLSVVTIRRLIRQGKLKPCRTLRHMLIPIRELDRFLAEGQ